jgi:DeoR family fructose operon transcriptional repressor
MLVDRRRREILRILQKEGYVEVTDLAEVFAVSLATVRRDLLTLENEGLLVRTHGGAVSNSASTAWEPSWDSKRTKMLEAKRLIGREAASLIQPGETIILDAGSTTWHVADHLKPESRLTVISNDLQILLRLASLTPGCTVVSTGGVVRESIYVLYGSEAERFIKSLKVNWAFLGANGLDLERGLTNSNLVTVSLRKAMIQASKRVVVLADHTKFNQVALAQVCELSEIDMIITDTGLDEDTARRFRDAGVEIRQVALAESQLEHPAPDGRAGDTV